MNSENAISNQQNCANQASKAYIAEGYGSADKSGDLTSYVDHYNQKLNKCFIEIYDHSYRPGVSSLGISLIDAYELKEYASYSDMSFYGLGDKGGPSIMCNLDEQTPDVSTRAADCTSQVGFESYAATYMEN